MLQKGPYNNVSFSRDCFLKSAPDTVFLACRYWDMEALKRLGWRPSSSGGRRWSEPSDLSDLTVRLSYYPHFGNLRIEFEVGKVIAGHYCYNWEPWLLDSLIHAVDEEVRSRVPGFDTVRDLPATRMDVRVLGNPMPVEEYRILRQLYRGLPEARKNDEVRFKQDWAVRGRSRTRAGLTIYPKPYLDDQVVPQFELHHGTQSYYDRLKNFGEGRRTLADLLGDQRTVSEVMMWGLRRYGIHDLGEIQSVDLVIPRVEESNMNWRLQRGLLAWLKGKPVCKSKGANDYTSAKK